MTKRQGVPPISPDMLRRLLGEPAELSFDRRPPFIHCDPPLTWWEKLIVALSCIPGLALGYIFARALWDGTW